MRWTVMPHRVRITFVLSVFALLTGPGSSTVYRQSAGDPEATPSYYMYFKERLEVQLDHSRIAVKYNPKASASARSAAPTTAGLAVAAATPTGIKDWSLLQLAAPAADPFETDGAIRRLGASGDIEFASPVFLQNNGGWMAVTPEILVRLEPDYRAQSDATLADLVGDAATVVERNLAELDGAYRLHCRSVNGFEVLALANRMAQDSRVAWAEPNFQATAVRVLIPNDPGFSDCWGLRNIGQSGGTMDMDMDADSAWDISLGSAEVGVLVIDDGVQQDHPDINQLPGADFTGFNTGGGPHNECDNHGTAVAGCVSATINNSLGTVGVAPGCKVVSAKYSVSNVPCDNSGTFTYTAFTNALTWAQSQGIRVTNLSSTFSPSSSVTDKYNSTHAAGMVHFVASGNDALGTVAYPAYLESVNAVGGITRQGTRASFSNYGAELDFVAPGVSIYSTDRTGEDGYTFGDYGYVDGTSFASPYAAGVAALVLSVDPWLTADEVEERMRTTAMDLGSAGWDSQYGWGLVNANAAIASAAIYVEAAPTFGTPPMTVSFLGTTARLATGWEWSFGDGQFAFEQNPVHEYAQPGHYTVDVTIITPDRSYSKEYPGLISIQADTLRFSNVEFDEFDTARVDISVRNYVPLKELTIPVTYNGPLDIVYRYVTAAGLRTEYFGTVETSNWVQQWKVATIHLNAGVQPALPPGDGPVATLVFYYGGTATGTNPVRDTTYLTRVLKFVTHEGEYLPVQIEDGSVRMDCCQGIVGDANGDGAVDPTIGDVSALIDHLFITTAPLECYSEADVNLSGSPNPTSEDITVGDISSLIDHLFISQTPPPPCP